MTPGKRILALLLAVILIGNLWPTGVFAATADSGGVEEVIFEESFESCTDALPAGWMTYTNSGSVAINPTSGEAYDGDVSIKLSPAETDEINRAQIVCTVPAEILDRMIDGEEYKVTAWYRGENADFKGQMQIKHKSDWTQPNFVLENGEWIEASYSFVLNKSEIPDSVLKMTFGIGWRTVINGGAMYIDKITLARVHPVPDYGITFEESFEGFADENTLITDEYSVKGGTSSWNGANYGSWNIYVNSGSVKVQPSLEETMDGKVSVKLTPSETEGGRAQIIYKFSEDAYSSLDDGGRYRVTAWYKADNDANFGAQMEVKATKDWEAIRYQLKNDAWIKCEHEFTLDKSSENSYGGLTITFGISAADGGGSRGSMYIDKVTLERLAYVDTLELNAEEKYLSVNDTYDLDYQLYPLGEQSEVTFTTSDSNIVTVDANGRITALKPGTATISAVATSGKASDTCTVHVVDQYIPVEQVAFSESSLKVMPGWQGKAEITITPADATVNQIQWSSSDENVVQIDEDGNMTAMGVGTAVISVKIGTVGASCTVNVEEDSTFVCTSREITVDFGKTSTVDLSQIYPGEYTVIENPLCGRLELNGSSLKYMSYTWMQGDEPNGFVDAVYTDSMKIAVNNGSKYTVITLNVTINTLAELFYDSNGNWISNVDLMFSEEQIEAVKQEILDDPSGMRAQLFDCLLVDARKILNNKPKAYTYPEAGETLTSKEDAELRTTSNRAAFFVMCYVLTKDMPGYESLNETLLDKAIEFLKAGLEYPYWGMMPQTARNCRLCAGHHLFSTSLGYHWLKEELKDVTCTHIIGYDGTLDNLEITEDMPILEAMEQRLWYVGSEMYERNKTFRTFANNHCNVRMGGLSAAAIALRGVADTSEKRQMLIDWTGMALAYSGISAYSQMPDGSSQEGVPYLGYAAEWSIKSSVILRQAFGIDLFETTQMFQYTGDYLLYMSTARDHWKDTGSVIPAGDSVNKHYFGPGMTLRFIAAEYGDATAQWFAGVFEADSNRGYGDGEGVSNWMSLMYADTTLEPVEPDPDELSKLGWFHDLDQVISRSDWSGDEDFVYVKCGIPCGKNLLQLVQSGAYFGKPDAAHSHPDANHITLYANGEFLLRDDGYMDKAAGNHNTLLINGTGQLGEGGNWMDAVPYVEDNLIPHIKLAESYEAEGFDYIVGDATQAYASSLNLQKFERNIVYLKEEQVMLVVDDIRTYADSELELRWFPTSKTVEKSDDAYVVRSDFNDMYFYAMSQGAETSFEFVDTLTQDGYSQEQTFRQIYTGSNWQNAVAFSWNDPGTEKNPVTYSMGQNDGEHCFSVNGKIYTVNVNTNEVMVEIEDTEDGNAVTPTLTLKAPTLEFKDMITVNALFTAENIENVVEMGMITYKEQVTEWGVETAAHVIPGTTYDVNTGCYIACSQGIHAKYLGDTVYLACYAKLTDDTYVYSKLASYSPLQYATNQLKNVNADAKLKQLVTAMLNYGAAAQNYFGYNTDTLANASLTEDQKQLPQAYTSDMVGTVPAADAAKQGIFANNKGFSLRKPAVSFEGAFSINYFFTPAYAPADGITLYYWTETDFKAVDELTAENATGSVAMEGEGISQYRGDITGISAKDLSKAVYVAAVYSDGTTTWTSGVLGYSIGAYCSSMAKGTGTMADLAMATAVYGYHAKQYFG